MPLPRSRQEVRDKLTGRGGPFEMVEEEVLGERLPVLKNRIPSLRALLEASSVHGDKEYLVHDGRRISYAEHLGLVGSVARGLAERHGVGKGDVVAVLAANCPAWPVAFWASVSQGAVVSAWNGWWTADEILYALEHSRPKVLVADRKRLERVRGLPAFAQSGVEVIEIESDFPVLESHAPGAPLPEVEIAEDDPAVILYTSGTTGRPKGAVGTHRGIVGFVQLNMLNGLEGAMVQATRAPAASEASPAAAPAADPGGQMVVLATAPMFHLSGLYAMIVMQLVAGGRLVIRSGRFDEEAVMALMEKERVTMWSALGGTGARVASHPALSRYDLSSVTSVGFGGAPTSPAVQEQVRRAFPNAATSLGTGYGSSETVTVVSSIRGPEYAEVPESAGYLCAGHEVEIRGEAGRVLGEGEEGRIFVRSAYLMREYWNDPEATAKAIGPGRWLDTGDVGRVDGGLLTINSRARDMILRNAENIYPIEVEYRLEQHPEVAEAAVIGVEHEVMGQEVKAIVVPKAGASPDPDALARFCAETLAGYKVPTLWDLRTAPLPRNAAGKILKNVLSGEASPTLIDD